MWMPAKNALVPLLAAALAASGCGGREDPPVLEGTVRGDRPLVVEAREYVLEPNRVTIVGGGPAREVTLANRGKLAHNIKLFDGDREIAALRSFPAGESRSLTATLDPGSYRFVCSVSDHEDLGMRGTIEVKE